MFKVVLLNKDNNKTFEKTFDSFYLYQNFVRKTKHSKKLRIISLQEN